MEVALSTFKKSFKYFKNCKILFCVRMFINLLISLLDLIEPYLYANIITGLYEKNFDIIKAMLIYILIINIVIIVFQFVSKKLELIVRKRISMYSKSIILEKLTTIKPCYISDYDQGKLMSLIYADTLSIWRYVNFLSGCIIDILTIIIIGYIVVRMNVVLTFISIVFYPIIYACYYVFGKLIKKQSQKMYISNDKFMNTLKRTINSLHEINFNSYGKKVKDLFLSDVENAIDDSNKCEKLQVKSSCVNDTISVIQYILLLTFGCWFVLTDKLFVGTFIAFSSYSKTLNSSLLKLSSLNSTLQSLIVGLERIFGFEQYFDEILQKENNKVKVDKIQGRIRLEDVSIGFDNEILSKVNLDIEENSYVALVGKNGCGKSTLLNLIVGMYEPNNGQILIDSFNFESINYNSFKNQIIYIKQNPVIFETSLLNNLLLFNNDNSIDMDKVIQVCKDINFYDDIEKMPNKFDTIIDENYNLSSGQLQKIQIARAILRNSKIILLDEPTVNLDYESRKSFYESFIKYFKDNTVITITHDLDCMDIYDNIYKIEDKTVKVYRKDVTV